MRSLSVFSRVSLNSHTRKYQIGFEYFFCDWGGDSERRWDHNLKNHHTLLELSFQKVRQLHLPVRDTCTNGIDVTLVMCPWSTFYLIPFSGRPKFGCNSKYYDTKFLHVLTLLPNNVVRRFPIAERLTLPLNIAI